MSDHAPKGSPGTTIATLRALLDKATPGPFTAHGVCVAGPVRDGYVFGKPLCFVHGRHDESTPEQIEQADNDAALIAALRNAAPDLLRVVEAARAMVTVCLYPCGDPRKCGNCNALRDALEALGR